MDLETYPSSWLVLLAQLPAKPSSARVALWRRMRAAGATPVVNGAWMLPRTAAHDDFFEQSREGVVRRGGTGFVLRVSSSSPESDESIVRLFQSDRSREYDEFAERCTAFLNEISRESTAEKYTFAEMEESEQDLKKLARWLAKIQARDFFPNGRRDESAALLAQCRRALRGFSRTVYKVEGVQEFAAGRDYPITLAPEPEEP
jgi:Protein ChrB, N-terminal